MDPNSNSAQGQKFETWAEKQDRERRENEARTVAVADAEPRDVLSVGELAKIRHVLGKYFPHDNPPDVEIAAGSAGFCPLCPAAVTNTHTDGTAVCASGHRFPVQSVRER